MQTNEYNPYLVHCIDPEWFPIRPTGCYLLQPIIVSWCFSLILQVLIIQEADWIGHSTWPFALICCPPFTYLDMTERIDYCSHFLDFGWSYSERLHACIVSTHGGYIRSSISYLHQVLVYACQPIGDLQIETHAACWRIAGTEVEWRRVELTFRRSDRRSRWKYKGLLTCVRSRVDRSRR